MKVVWRLVTVGLIDAWAYNKKKLTPNGCILALIIGVIHCLPPSSLYLSLLAAFFFAGTLASKVKTRTKDKYVNQLDSSNKPSSDHAPRSASQVWCNSGNAAVAIVIAQLIPLHWTFIDEQLVRNTITAHYAAVTADTLSSELGILAGSPYLITNPFRGVVPRGTNGGVSLGGLLAGSLGAFSIAYIAKLYSVDSLVSVTLWGILGTLVDSLLGATLQSSVVGSDGRVIEVAGSTVRGSGRDHTRENHVSGLDVLTNNQVNWLTSLLIMLFVYYSS